MRALIQRVKKAKVKVKNKTIGEIGKGLLVFLGVTHSDQEKDVDYLIDKILNLRIFQDSQNKMNLSLLDAKGSLLIVSQFTLYGNIKKGRRPSFIEAANPEKADRLYKLFVRKCWNLGIITETGRFQAMMEVELINNGPVTLMIESKK